MRQGRAGAGGWVHEVLWCVNLSSDGARAAKYKVDVKLPPSHEKWRAWDAQEEDQRKTLGMEVKEVLLRDGTHFIEVCLRFPLESALRTIVSKYTVDGSLPPRECILMYAQQ